MEPARYLLLDRDGVINQDSDAYIKSPAEWHPIPGSLEAIALLNSHGYRIIVITNQSGIARGYFDLAMLSRIHNKMHQAAAEHGAVIERIYYCPHGPSDNCLCRKPKPGMLEQFSRDYDVRLDTVTMIGDSMRDIESAQSVGAQPILVRSGKGERTLAKHPDINCPIFNTLHDAAQQLLAVR